MKTPLIFAGTVLITATLAACSPGIHGKFGYSVTFQNGELVAHAPGRPNAFIGADGSLRIGDRAIAVTPPQRALLKNYYGESKTIVDAGVATGKAGAELGAHAIGDAIASIFSSKSKQAEQDLNARANAVSASAQKICADVNRLHDTQQAIAAQLPAFKPYEAFDNQMHCEVTTTGSSVTVAQSSSRSTKVIETEKKAAAH